MISILRILIMLLIVFSCSKKDEKLTFQEIEKFKINIIPVLKVDTALGIIKLNTFHSINNKLIITDYNKNQFDIIGFNNTSPNNVIKFSKGQGPAELGIITGSFSDEQFYYSADLQNQKIIVYDKNYNLLKEYFNKTGIFIGHFFVNNNFLYTIYFKGIDILLYKFNFIEEKDFATINLISTSVIYTYNNKHEKLARFLNRFKLGSFIYQEKSNQLIVLDAVEYVLIQYDLLNLKTLNINNLKVGPIDGREYFDQLPDELDPNDYNPGHEAFMKSKLLLADNIFLDNNKILLRYYCYKKYLAEAAYYQLIVLEANKISKLQKIENEEYLSMRFSSPSSLPSNYIAKTIYHEFEANEHYIEKISADW